jgi:hypothetical protein
MEAILNTSKLKMYLLLVTVGIISSIVLLLVINSNLPVENSRVPLRQTQRPVRATSTYASPPTRLLNSTFVSPHTTGTISFTLTLTPTLQPPRIDDATLIPTPIPILVNPIYAP